MNSARPVAVVHTLPDLAVGGGQVLLLRTLAAMPGDTTHVVFALAAGPMGAAYEAAGIEVVVAADRRRAPIELAALVRRRGIDVVHTNHTAADRIVGQLAAALGRIPVVNTFHGVAPARSKLDVARAINTALVRTNIAHFVAVSGAVAASYRDALQIRPERLTVVPPGLPSEAFVRPSAADIDALRRALGLTADTLAVLVVARLVDGKGHRLVLDAIARLTPDVRVQLLLAGDGPEQAPLEAYARQLGIAGCVTFLGRRDDVPVLLACADVVVSGSEAEGFPLNVLEAMAQQRPIVAAALPAFDGVLVDGVNALVVAHRAEAMAAALRALHDDPALARSLGAAAGETAEGYTAARTAEALVSIYRSVLGHPAPVVAAAAAAAAAAGAGAARPMLHDGFATPVRRGRVLGTATRTGHRRAGVDAEGLMSIDDGGARLAPLARPGWARAGLAYGPVAVEPGTTFVVHLLNGHNAAQEHPVRNRLKLLGRWAVASGTDSPARRVVPLLRHSARESLVHRLRRFSSLDRLHATDALDTTNLALGWFDEMAPALPLDRPGTVVVSGSAEDSGVMSVVGASGAVIGRERLGEMPMRIAGVSGPDGIVVFAAVGVEVDEAVTYRPIGRAATPPARRAWLGIHQRIMGEIGFSPDTRLYEVAADVVPEWSSWWTTAVVADRPEGSGPVDLAGSEAPTGQQWRLVGTNAVIDGEVPLGLVAATVRPGDETGGASLGWRVDPTMSSGWWLRLAADGGVLERVADGRRESVHRFPTDADRDGDREFDLVVIDSADTMRVILDGRVVWTGPSEHPGAGATGLAIGGSTPGWAVTRLEGHPAALALPAPLDVEPQRLAPGTAVVWSESFDGDAPDLDGRIGSPGRWERTLGPDRFLVADGVVRVDADRDRPSAGRTLFTVPWAESGFVDLSVTIRPPGGARGEGQSGRGGLVLWQDPSTYLVVNTWLDDGFAGSSVSVFPHLGGFEDVLDAVWVNVGDRIRWGRPYDLRVICDGSALALLVGSRPVLYRRLTDIDPRHPTIELRRVGLATNWEWGVDTGTEFSALVARRR